MIVRWALMFIAAWVAGTISGTVGFGGALILLPVLTLLVGAKAAVPILTLAQLLGNLSRAAFGWSDIRWRPALAFLAGALPAAIAGSLVFLALPPAPFSRALGAFLIVVVALHHSPPARRRVPGRRLAVAGAVVGFLSAIAGSAGPLGAAVFLSLRLPPPAYLATEASAASALHLAKALVYRRYDALGRAELLGGLGLGGAMVLGSWTGRALVKRVPEGGFRVLVEMLLIVAAVSLIVG